MRTKFFFFFAMLASVAACAQNVQVESISATYTSTPIVKFRVAWTGVRTYRHNTKVWVFIDYRKVDNNTSAGTWTRALVSSTPTASSTHVSTITLESGNSKGFWLHGANGDYSATITVPITLDAGVTQFNWCAYASDYSPNVVAHSGSSYTLHGSRPFVVNGTTLPTNQTTFSGTIISFTDATGAPGIFPAASGEKPNEMGCLPGLVENIDGICVAPSAVGCNNSTLNLGTVSFTSGTEITIIGDNVSQVWSRPVTATGCQKTNYNGGSNSIYYADCRTNPNFAGDFFSQCAVVRYAEKICPPPWRVPSIADTRKLFFALGATSQTITNGKTFIVDKLIGTWASQWSSYCSLNGGLQYELHAAYWSSYSRCGIKFTGDVSYDQDYMADSCWGMIPYWGNSVRCVK
jgi:hypothetical protein